jgi:hypothetical protein
MRWPSISPLSATRSDETRSSVKRAPQFLLLPFLSVSTFRAVSSDAPYGAKESSVR